MHLYIGSGELLRCEKEASFEAMSVPLSSLEYLVLSVLRAWKSQLHSHLLQQAFSACPGPQGPIFLPVKIGPGIGM